MNRLILIGNGFDLSLGLRTGYKDFLYSYLEECFDESFRHENGYQDKLIEIKPSKELPRLRPRHNSFDELYSYIKHEELIECKFKFELLDEIHENSMLNG
ncbi:MAG: hypothetical protein HQ522_07525 [Bacteroidetes bacterium]|nr:hypothetical protein [Bacteroidota bacterium]